MGHIHLGLLPKSRDWLEVVTLLGANATDKKVVAASAIAAQKDLLAAARDPVFAESMRLLALVPMLGRAEDFGQALRNNDIPAPHSPDLFGLTSAIGIYLDSHARSIGRTNDFQELTRRALLSTITSHVGDRIPGLLASTPADVHRAARHLSNPNEFSAYARGYFARLVGETLRYWLDRELANHTGPRERFADIRGRNDFDRALMQFSMEATRIMKEFAAGWFAKNVYAGGSVTRHTSAAFGAIALKKIIEELHRKQGSDG